MSLRWFGNSERKTMTKLCCWVSYDIMWYPRSAGRPRTFDRLLACIQLDWFTIISFHFFFFFGFRFRLALSTSFFCACVDRSLLRLFDKMFGNTIQYNTTRHDDGVEERRKEGKKESRRLLYNTIPLTNHT